MGKAEIHYTAPDEATTPGQEARTFVVQNRGCEADGLGSVRKPPADGDLLPSIITRAKDARDWSPVSC